MIIKNPLRTTAINMVGEKRREASAGFYDGGRAISDGGISLAFKTKKKERERESWYASQDLYIDIYSLADSFCAWSEKRNIISSISSGDPATKLLLHYKEEEGKFPNYQRSNSTWWKKKISVVYENFREKGYRSLKDHLSRAVILEKENPSSALLGILPMQIPPGQYACRSLLFFFFFPFFLTKDLWH